MTWRTISLVAVSSALFVLGLVANISCDRAGVPRAETASRPTVTTKGGLEMVLIPAGSFEMGNRHGKGDDTVVHRVAIAAFWMDRYEVTQAEYERHELPNPSHFKGPTLPVEQVTWAQAAFYCNVRSQAEGLKPCYNEATGDCNFHADGYRLPTEAEWEYACRAETTADYSFGTDDRKLGEHGWFADNASKKTHPVGQKKPNAWGLYDMHGNIAEWCNDMYAKDYYAQSPADNPRGPTGGNQYVLRGGSWKSSADALRSSYRLAEDPGFSDACLARDAIGFRCVRKPPD